MNLAWTMLYFECFLFFLAITNTFFFNCYQIYGQGFWVAIQERAPRSGQLNKSLKSRPLIESLYSQPFSICCYYILWYYKRIQKIIDKKTKFTKQKHETDYTCAKKQCLNVKQNTTKKKLDMSWEIWKLFSLEYSWLDRYQKKNCSAAFDIINHLTYIWEMYW